MRTWVCFNKKKLWDYRFIFSLRLSRRVLKEFTRLCVVCMCSVCLRVFLSCKCKKIDKQEMCSKCILDLSKRRPSQAWKGTAWLDIGKPKARNPSFLHNKIILNYYSEIKNCYLIFFRNKILIFIILLQFLCFEPGLQAKIRVSSLEKLGWTTVPSCSWTGWCGPQLGSIWD